MKEQRKHLRFPITAIAEVAYSQNITCIACTVNISRGGIGLYSITAVAEGNQVKLKIKFKDIWQKEKVETLCGEILYCYEWHSVYVLGVKFDHVLNHIETPGLAEYLEQCERLNYLFSKSIKAKPAPPYLLR